MKKSAMKEALTAKVMSCGGLWQTNQQMKEKLKKLQGKQREDALKDQIKFRKEVLQAKLSDKKLLQLSAAKHQFTPDELESNLSKIISESPSAIPVSEDQTSSVLCPPEERKRRLQLAMERRRETEAKKLDFEPKKKKKVDFPNIEGKRMMHKWQLNENTTEWFEGVIGEALDDMTSEDCRFEVTYYGDD